MKKTQRNMAGRKELGTISTATLGDIKGVIEGGGLYTPAIRLS